eukprot:g7835.t1
MGVPYSSLRNSGSSPTIPWNEVVSGEKNLDGFFIAPIPVHSSYECFDRSTVPLMNIRGRTELVQSIAPFTETREAFRALEGFASLRHVDFSFIGEARTLHEFPYLPLVQSLSVTNINFDEAALESLLMNSSLQFLRLNDLQFYGQLNCLSRLSNLRKLKITGYVPCLSTNCRFLNTMPHLQKVNLEMIAPEDNALDALSGCSAAVSLKIHGRCIHKILPILSSIPCLRSLTCVTPCCLNLPETFQDLKSLQSAHFVGNADTVKEIIGLENLPDTVSELSLDLNSCCLSYDPFPDKIAAQITHLILKAPKIGNRLGLTKISNLRSLKLLAKNELYEEALQDLENLSYLEHLEVGGCINMESALLNHISKLKIRSLAILNTEITPEGLSGLQSMDSLQSVAFHCCVFSSCVGADFFQFFENVEYVKFDRCIPIE